MLAMKFTSPSTNLLASDGNQNYQAPSAQFAKIFMPLANLTTIPVNVSAAIQGDLVIKCSYTHCNFQWDIGYNLWGRSCEKICYPRNSFDKIACAMWGLKGNAFVFGFPLNSASVGQGVLQPGVPLSATQSNATIFSGTDNYPTMVSDNQIYNWNQNINIDNAAAAFNNYKQPLATHTIGNTSPTNVFDPVATSAQPILLSLKDLDLEGARSSGLSHKIFTHFEWISKEYCLWTPYIGAGFEIEFGQHSPRCFATSNSCSSCSSGCSAKNTVTSHDYSDNCCKNQCSTSCNQKTCCTSSCTNCSLSQWGIWLKGGFSYN